MAAPTLEQWLALWSRIGATGDGRRAWSELERRYREPHRAYHNFDHIGHCLTEFDAVKKLAESPDAVELAIWFHDVVYDTHAKDNEDQSIRHAATELTLAGLGANFIDRVSGLILATKHASPPASPDAALLVDIDLAILGQPRARYETFEREIRQEYAWVAAPEFVAGRSAILHRFLERPRIYTAESLRVRYEEPARRNLAWAIDELSRGA